MKLLWSWEFSELELTVNTCCCFQKRGGPKSAQSKHRPRKPVKKAQKDYEWITEVRQKKEQNVCCLQKVLVLFEGKRFFFFILCFQLTSDSSDDESSKPQRKRKKRDSDDEDYVPGCSSAESDRCVNNHCFSANVSFVLRMRPLKMGRNEHHLMLIPNGLWLVKITSLVLHVLSENLRNL